jgi:predicted extracellular nuclease
MIVIVLILVSATVQMVSAETAHVANHVVISELFYDETGTDCNEFCEFYNPTDSDIDIGGWKLKAFDQTGALKANTTLSVGATIGAL